MEWTTTATGKSTKAAEPALLQAIESPLKNEQNG
jgi:hypothetical protein